jgi:hypothetical protein
MLIMRMFVSSVIIYLDQLLVEVMSIIRKHSRVDFAQRGRYFFLSSSSDSGSDSDC